jgi:membrane protein DedA with SNARE-associated domain
MPHSIESLFLGWVFAIYETIGWVGVGLLMVLESTGVPFPSELVMPVAGWVLVSAQGKGLWWVLVAGVIGGAGNLGGSLLTYWVARMWGRDWLLKYGKFILVKNSDIDRCDVWFSKYGEFAVCFGRMLPLFRTFISIPAGVAKMNLFKFTVYTFVGGLGWCFALALLGFVMGENWEEIRGLMRPFEIPIGIGLLVILIWMVLKRLRQVRTEKISNRGR